MIMILLLSDLLGAAFVAGDLVYKNQVAWLLMRRYDTVIEKRLGPHDHFRARDPTIPDYVLYVDQGSACSSCPAISSV